MAISLSSWIHLSNPLDPSGEIGGTSGRQKLQKIQLTYTRYPIKWYLTGANIPSGRNMFTINANSSFPIQKNGLDRKIQIQIDIYRYFLTIRSIQQIKSYSIFITIFRICEEIVWDGWKNSRFFSQIQRARLMEISLNQ